MWFLLYFCFAVLPSLRRDWLGVFCFSCYALRVLLCLWLRLPHWEIGGRARDGAWHLAIDLGARRLTMPGRTERPGLQPFHSPFFFCGSHRLCVDRLGGTCCCLSNPGYESLRVWQPQLWIYSRPSTSRERLALNRAARKANYALRVPHARNDAFLASSALARSSGCCRSGVRGHCMHA